MRDRVQSVLEDVHADIPVSAPPKNQLRAIVERLADRRRRRRQIGVAGGSLVVAALVVVGVVALQRNDDDNSLSIVSETTTLTSDAVPPQTDASAVTTAVTDVASAPVESTVATETTTATSAVVESTESVAGGSSPWGQAIPDPPLAERWAALVESMGSSLIVWGGAVPNHLDGSEPGFADGAVFDEATQAWRPTATSPLPGGPARGVWTGTELVVSNAGSVAAYDPAGDAWRALQPPTAQGLDAMALLGGEVFFLPAAVAWNTTDDSWRTFKPPPRAPIDARVSVWADKIVVFGATVEESPLGTGLLYEAASDEWVFLPDDPIGQIYDGVGASVVGNELIIVSWAVMAAAALDLDTLEWRSLPNFPSRVVKCSASVEPTSGQTVVVSMCGQHAALAPGAEHWVPFDPPSKSSFFDLLAQDDGTLVIEGSMLDTNDPAWISSPALGPVTLAGLTIDRSVEPQEVAFNGTLVATLAGPSCTVEVSEATNGDVKTLAAAAQSANDGPESIEFWNSDGDYALSCPSAASYSEAIAALAVRGELSSPTDVTSTFESALEPAATPEALAYAAADLLEQRHTNGDQSPSVGLSAPRGTPMQTIVDVYTFVDDSTEGYSYVLTLAETTEGWVIDTATVQSICTRGASLGTPIACV